MKYLIMEDFSGKPIPFIFPRRIDHSDMRDQLPYTKVISGGYMELKQNTILCFGGYPELNLEASQDDAKIIAKALQQE